MNKLTTYLIFFLISLTITFGQTLCPPSFLNASPEDREVSLFWSAPDTVFYGDILLEECFSDCDSAINAFSIEYSVDNNSRRLVSQFVRGYVIVWHGHDSL